jgi:CBS domain-containing protein
MERADVGRLPVLDEGGLVGIVTRTDLLRALYGDAARAEIGVESSSAVRS